MKIVAYYDPPPIPIRKFDWCAYDDETYDEGGTIGWGRTEADARKDFADQLTD